MSKQSVLWVVEVKKGKVWVPTIGAYLSRAMARVLRLGDGLPAGQIPHRQVHQGGMRWATSTTSAMPSM